MEARLNKRWAVIGWQLLFLLLGTSWLWAPLLNHQLSPRTALISQYETGSQPYAWLFRLCDVLAAIMLVYVAQFFIKQRAQKWTGILLLVIGLGMLIDPLVPTTCHIQAAVCEEYVSPLFILHAIETCLTAAAFFVIGVYDSWQRKRLVSFLFVSFQIAYALLFISQFASHEQFNTLSQYLYQTVLVVWLAWLVGDLINIKHTIKPSEQEASIVKRVVAGWAFINGILAILLSLSHIRLAGRLRGLYFSGNYAWLAQHGVVVGIIMLYLSRHLARGERRARQIFLWLACIEVLKYAVVTPNPTLLLVYLTAFCLLFVFKDDFDRGTMPLTVQVRVRDALYMLGSLLFVSLLGLLLLYRNARQSAITNQALDHFLDFTLRSKILPDTHIRSVLLDHTITVFVLASLASILWILFRPNEQSAPGQVDEELINNLLKKHSVNTEDYFKQWPHDKQYFVTEKGFIAYKVVGPIAFAIADPISSPSQYLKLVDDFVAWCRAHRLRACFIPIFESSKPLYEQAKLRTVQIGASAVVPIKEFIETTAGEKWWRWQKNRAQKQGYEYHVSQPPHDTQLLKNLKSVSNSWLSFGGHQEFGFLLGYFDKGYLQACNIHYLTDQAGAVVAFTNEVPTFRHLPTTTVDLLRHRADADNAMPFLLLKTIETAGENNQSMFDLGFVPFAATKSQVASITRTLSGGRFSAKGLEQFKNKFKPDWQPQYVAYDGDLADLTLIAIHVEKAMSLQKTATD